MFACREADVAAAVFLLAALAVPCTAQTPLTVTAHRIDQPLDVDGRLNEEIYQQIEAATGFVQQEPRENTDASERTDIWVLYDSKTLYFAARCWDSQPEREIATEMRRDSSNIVSNESLAVIFDTFRDLKNGLAFQTNPLGARRDMAVVDTQNSETWNTVWDARTNRSDQGFTVEMAIPFKSLRYPSAGAQVWGINVRRIIKWKNEVDYLAPQPAAYGINGLSHTELAATLVGLETPGQSMNLELKPYVVAALTSDLAAAKPFEDDLDHDIGFDFKYGLTRGLILDATVNTDFAQVEEDQQQVNLTRFSLFFPEKRDFFLESQGNFAFGGVSSTSGNPGDVPVMFFSRQIGLTRGQAIPVIAGARLTGRTGRYQIGALNIQTAEKASAAAFSTNFTTVRVKRDFLRRSTVGVIATRRSPTLAGAGDNVVLGADVNLLLYRNVSAAAYYARSDSPGFKDGQASYRGRFDYSGDRWGYAAEHLLIGQRFDPQVGFVRRTDYRSSYGLIRFSPRPKNSRRVRKYTYTASIDYITDARVAFVQDKTLEGIFNIEYQNGNNFNVDFVRSYELVRAPFSINPGTIVPAGGYDYDTLRTYYSIGQQKRISGRISAGYGTLYGGRRTEAGYSGRIAFVPQFALEPGVALNWVRLPYGDFSAPVVSTRIVFTPNPRTALTSLLQYNGSSHGLSSSVRLRWEYVAGSELFIVYSDGRNTHSRGYPDMLNRSLAFKVTRLLRF